LRQFAVLDRPGDAVGDFRHGIGALAEDEITGGEPHGVMGAAGLGMLGIAALVHAVGVEQAEVQMAAGGVRDVLDDDGLQVRRDQLTERLAALFDDAGGGERVPQGLAEAGLQEQLLLGEARIAVFFQELARGVDQLAAARLQRRVPGRDRRPADQGAGGDVGPLGVEPAVQLVAGLLVRAGIGMAGEDFLAAIAQLGRHVPPARSGWLSAYT
jgi:hypothetical protein